jgi:hypothetical protein
MGTPLTPNDMNPPEAAFPEFHNVYIHPKDFAHYKMTGNFQDGTIIVKELVLVGAKQAVSGNGYFMGDFVGLEATIKGAHHFKNEPGNWAYFSFGHSYPLAKTATAFPTASCNTCHAASAMDDFVFTQYYPVLRAAKGGQNGGRSMNAQAPEFQKIAASMEGALERGSKANAPPEKWIPKSLQMQRTCLNIFKKVVTNNSPLTNLLYTLHVAHTQNTVYPYKSISITDWINHSVRETKHTLQAQLW